MTSVGFLTLDIIPSVKNISAEIQSQIVSPATQGGVRAGEGISSGIVRVAAQGAANAGKAIQTEVASAGAKGGADAGRAIQTEISTAGARAGREAGTGITAGVVQGSARAGTDAGRVITVGVAEGGVKGAREAGAAITAGVAQGGIKGGTEAGAAITKGVAEGGIKGGREAGLGIEEGVHKGATAGAEKAKRGIIGSLGGLAATIGGMWAATKVFDFFKESTQNAKDYNAVNRVVQATLKNVGEATGITSEEFKKLSERNADLSGKGDQMQLTMQKVLLGFTGIKNSGSDKMFDNTTVAVNDLSAAMHIGLEPAAVVLGKALDDPSKAAMTLRRAHIDLTEEQKKSIASFMKVGDHAGAQRAILKSVEDRFHGVAAASTTTSQRNEVAMERMKTEVGQKLLPAFAKWNLFMAKEIIPNVAKMVEWLGEHAKQVGIMVGVIAGVLVAYRLWTVAQKVLTLVMGVHNAVVELSKVGWKGLNETMKGNVIILIITLVVALVAAFIYAYTHFKGFHDIVDKVLAVLKVIGKFIADVFIAIWHMLLAVIRWVIDHWKAFAMVLVILLGPIALIIGAIILLAKHWKEVMHFLGEVFSWLWHTVLKPIFGFLGPIFTWLWVSVLKPFLAFMRQGVEAWAAIFTWLWDHIGPAMKLIGDIFTWLYQNIVKPVVAFIVGTIQVLGVVFAWLYQNIIKPYVAFIVGTIQVLGAIFSWLWTAINTVIGFIGAVFSWLYNNIVKPYVAFIVGAIRVLGAIFSWLWEAIVFVFHGIEVAVAIFAAIFFAIFIAPAIFLIREVLVPVFMWLWARIKQAFELIGALFSWLYTNIVLPYIAFIKAAIQVAADVFTWLGGVIKAALQIIADVFTWAWNTVIKPVFGFIKGAIEVTGAALYWFRDNVVKPVWDAIGAAIQWVWEKIIKQTFLAIQVAIGMVGAAFSWFYDHVVKPVWDSIGAAIQWVWEHVIKTSIDAIKSGIDGLGKVFQWLYDNVIKPVWDAIGKAIQFFWDQIVTPIFKWIIDRAHDVGNAFVKFGETVGGIWDGLKHLVHDGVQAVINFVWNDGLMPVVNGIIEWIPGGPAKLTRFDLPAFAGGGLIPGYAPGRDTVPALLSPGEAVLVPELVRLLGPEVILSANAAAAQGRFGRGGLVGHFADGGIAGAVASAAPAGATAAAATVATPTPADLKAIQDAAALTTTAVLALATSITAVLVPAEQAMSVIVTTVVIPALALAQLHLGTLTPQANDRLVASTVASWARISATISTELNTVTVRQTVLENFLTASWAKITATIVADENTLTARQTDLQRFLTDSWTAISAAVGTSVTAQGSAFTTLQAGLTAVRTAVGLTATWVHDQFLLMQGHAGVPVHWILQFPFNAGLIAAWNKLDKDFALNKHVTDVAIPFATGGPVRGAGTGTSDSIPAWLSHGEYIIPAAIAAQTMPFLDALRGGQAAAMKRAAGYAGGGPVWPFPTKDPSQYRRIDDGWDLQYAGTNPVGINAVQSGTVGVAPPDPGGFGMSYPLLNLDSPAGRFPTVYYGHTWVDTGLIGRHVAQGQTLGRTGGLHSGGNAFDLPNWLEIGFWPPNMANGPAMKSWLEGGGATGGAGPGGSPIDVGAVVNPAFQATFDFIAEIGKRFAGQTTALMGQGIAQQAADKVKAIAMEKLSASAIAGGIGPATGDAKVAQDYARSQLAKFGWDNAAQWGALLELWQNESGWINKMNLAGSGATGIPQALPGSKMADVSMGGGPDWRTNISTQINWGLNYIRQRYNNPVAANAFWHNQSPHYYDTGGIVPQGTTVVHNGTSGPEALLTGQQWSDIHDLATQRAVDGPHVTVNARTDATPEHIAAVTSRSVQRAMRT